MRADGVDQGPLVSVPGGKSRIAFIRRRCRGDRRETERRSPRAGSTPPRHGPGRRWQLPQAEHFGKRRMLQDLLLAGRRSGFAVRVRRVAGPRRRVSSVLRNRLATPLELVTKRTPGRATKQDQEQLVFSLGDFPSPGIVVEPNGWTSLCGRWLCRRPFQSLEGGQLVAELLAAMGAGSLPIAKRENKAKAREAP